MCINRVYVTTLNTRIYALQDLLITTIGDRILCINVCQSHFHYMSFVSLRFWRIVIGQKHCNTE